MPRNPGTPGNPSFGLEAAKRRAAIPTKAAFANVPVARTKDQLITNDARQVRARQVYEDIPEARVTRKKR